MTFDALPMPPVDVVLAATTAVSPSPVPSTPAGQCTIAPIDAVPFLVIGALAGAVIGKAIGRRQAVQKLTGLMSGRDQGGKS